MDQSKVKHPDAIRLVNMEDLSIVDDKVTTHCDKLHISKVAGKDIYHICSANPEHELHFSEWKEFPKHSFGNIYWKEAAETMKKTFKDLLRYLNGEHSYPLAATECEAHSKYQSKSHKAKQQALEMVHNKSTSNISDERRKALRRKRKKK